MLFSRRQPAHWKETLRISLWPRRSYARSTKYVIKRILRLQGTPHTIALGSAAGVLASFTPYMGMHFALAALIAWILRGNLIASALGTFVGNPLTFPLIWLVAYNSGNFLLGNSGTMNNAEIMGQLGNLSSAFFDGSWSDLGNLLMSIWPTLLLPMTVGGLAVGSVVSVIFYFIVYRIVDSYKKSRQTFPKQQSLTGHSSNTQTVI